MASLISDFIPSIASVPSLPAMPSMPGVSASISGATSTGAVTDGFTGAHTGFSTALSNFAGGLPNFLTAPSLELAIVAGRAVFLVVAFTVLAMAIRHWRRVAERDSQRVFEQVDIALSEIRSLSEQTQAVIARMSAFEERLDATLRIAPAVSSAPQRGYETAVRIARTGAGIEQIINMCGLTRHEAELLVRLHAPAHAPSQAQGLMPTQSSQQSAPPAPDNSLGIDESPEPVIIAAPVELVGSAQEERRKARSRLSVVS